MEDHLQDEQVLAIARLMKSISHPIRFKILCMLQDEEVSVGDLRDRLQTSGPNITQHLNILRNQGIIDFRKDANYIYNRIIDERIIELIGTMLQLYFSTPVSSASKGQLLQRRSSGGIPSENTTEM